MFKQLLAAAIAVTTLGPVVYGQDAKKAHAAPAGRMMSPQAIVNAALQKQYGDKWRVATDATQKYDKYYMDSFITPQRINNQFYPFLVKSDFDGNSKPDYAAIVVGEKSGEVKLAILLNDTKFFFLDEQGALSLYRKSKLQSPHEKGTVKMRADGILCEYFEKSGIVIYWNGKTFKEYFISD